MRRAPILAVLSVSLLIACSPSVPSPSPDASPSPVASLPSKLADPVRACHDPKAFETPLPSGVTEPVDLYDTSYSPADGIPGGGISIGVLRAPVVFNPLRATDVRDTLLIEATWSGLVYGTNDYKWQPDLAAVVPTTVNGMVAVDSSGGPMSVLWCLRPGSTWSDGAALTCADFQYAATWLTDIAPDPRRFGPIARVDCPAPDVMVVAYAGTFEAYLAHALIPLPRHALAGRPIANLQAGAPFTRAELTSTPTSGAFHVTGTDGTTFELARNAGYRGGHRGAPAYLDTLTITAYPSRSALIGAFEGGSVELATDVAWTDIASLEAAGLHDSVAAAPGFAYDTMRFNLGTQVAGDSAIREALAHVIDMSAVRAALGPADELQATDDVVAPQAWFYLEQYPKTYDRADALAALAAGGWKLTANGSLFRSRDDRVARMRVCTIDDAQHRAVAALLERAGATLGIEIDSTFVAAAQLTAPFDPAGTGLPCAVAQGDYDIAIMALDSFFEPLDFRQRYHGAFFEPTGINDGRVNVDAINDALDKVSGTVDFARIKDAMQAFQGALRDATVELPIDARKDVALVRTEKAPGLEAMQNFIQDSPGGPPTWNAEDWFVKP